MIGRKLLHYEIVEKLGQGGMGEVYRARDQKLGRDVALKILPDELAADPDRRKRFEREARAVAALKHPNIVTLHSIEEAGGVHFITMEYVEGETLSADIVEGGLPLEKFFELAIPLADALSTAHAKGIAHRDLKPANIMRDADGRLKILDFGLAKLFETDPESDATMAAESQTDEGRIMGTVAYMSPEQAEGLAVDARSDVFSLGIVLYEMATGNRPFQGKTNISTLSAILKDTPPSVTEVRPIFPRHLGRIISHCLAKDPGRRYQSALDVRNELEGLQGEITSGDLDVPAGAAREYMAKPPMQARRFNKGVVGLAAVALVAIVIAAIVTQRGGDSAQTTRVTPPPQPVAPSAGATTAADTRSIAVLPFVNMSADAANEPFADGLSEELMNVLAKIPNLRVAARTSSFHFKGHTGDMAEIGEKLNVSHILEGSVRRAGDRVKITTQLIKASDGFNLWSQTYERTLDDIFAIQEEIATEVAEAMQITLLGADHQRLADRPTQNTEAYEAYLAGRPNLAVRNSETLKEAERLFRKATELDPTFAEAYVYLAESIYHQASYGTLNQDDAVSRAKPLIEKALELDPNLSEAHALSGLLNFRGDAAASLAPLERAIELNPNNAMAHAWYALALGGIDRDKRRFHNARAIELDPLAPVPNVNEAYWQLEDGNIDEAERLFTRVTEFAPESAMARIGLGTLYTNFRQDYERAIEQFEKGIAADPRSAATRMAYANALATMGDLERAKAMLEEAVRIDPGYARSYEQLSDLHRDSGALDEAVRFAMKALERDPSYLNSMVDLSRLYLGLDDPATARKWIRRIEEETDGGVDGYVARWGMALYEGDSGEAARQVALVNDRFPLAFANRRAFFAVTAGDTESARKILEADTPGIFSDDYEPSATDLDENLSACFVLRAEGKHKDMTRRLAKIDAFLASRREETRVWKYGWVIAGSAVLHDRLDEAVDAYEQAFDEGLIVDWYDVMDFVGDNLKDDTRFRQLQERVRERVARQRATLATEGLANSP